MKPLGLQEGVVQHLENEMFLRNSLVDMPLDARIKKVGKMKDELKK